MGNQNVMSKRTIAADLKNEKYKSSKAYGTPETSLKYRGRSQTPSAAYTRKSKRKFVLENKELDEAQKKEDQSQSQSQINYQKRSAHGREIDIGRRGNALTQSQGRTKMSRGSRAGRRNIFQDSSKPSESQGAISTASSVLNNPNDSVISKQTLAALLIPEELIELNEEDRKKVMGEIYLQEFRSDRGAVYYIDRNWLDYWISYMKEAVSPKSKPKEITNKRLWKMFQNNQEIIEKKDAYCLNK